MVFALYLELSRPRRTLGGRDVVVVDHTTVFRWVQRYATEMDGRCRAFLWATKDSDRVDETYIKVKKQWCDLYRAVNSEGNTIDFMLSTAQDSKAAERFFSQGLSDEPSGPTASHRGNGPRDGCRNSGNRDIGADARSTEAYRYRYGRCQR